MKIVIDIPEWKYKSICEGIEASKRCGVVGIDPDIHEAIYNGIPYEETSQGEWEDYSVDFYKCPECGYLLEKFCPYCQNKVVLPKSGANNG